jgi:hypothetical protein
MNGRPIWITKQEEVLEAYYARPKCSPNDVNRNESQEKREALREIIDRVRQQATQGKPK